MKILKCQKCNKTQGTGKFCLDCGSILKEIITSNVKFNPVKTNKPSEIIKKDVRNWLGRLGVQQTDIKIGTNLSEVTVEYILNKKLYKFSSHLQRGITENLGAVEMFLHARVIGIERGIESVEQAFSGYEALPDFTGMENPYDVMSLERNCTNEEVSGRFKQLAMKFHPDVNKSEGAELQFNRMKNAYDEIKKLRGM